MKRVVDREEAAMMRKFGFTYKQIAEQLGCSVQWCATYLQGVAVDEQYLLSAYKQYKEKLSTKE